MLGSLNSGSPISYRDPKKVPRIWGNLHLMPSHPLGGMGGVPTQSDHPAVPICPAEHACSHWRLKQFPQKTGLLLRNLNSVIIMGIYSK